MNHSHGRVVAFNLANLAHGPAARSLVEHPDRPHAGEADDLDPRGSDSATRTSRWASACAKPVLQPCLTGEWAGHAALSTTLCSGFPGTAHGETRAFGCASRSLDDPLQIHDQGAAGGGTPSPRRCGRCPPRTCRGGATPCSTRTSLGQAALGRAATGKPTRERIKRTKYERARAVQARRVGGGKALIRAGVAQATAKGRCTSRRQRGEFFKACISSSAKSRSASRR